MTLPLCQATNHMLLLQSADECVSHILLVPDDKRHIAHKIVNVLEHSGCEVDERLRRMCAVERKLIDIQRNRPLCHLMKATGVCRYVHCAHVDSYNSIQHLFKWHFSKTNPVFHHLKGKLTILDTHLLQQSAL